MLYDYSKFLSFLDEKLNGFFESQKPFICCKEGCCKCCENAEFPYTKLEFDYLMLGYMNLDKKTKQLVDEKIDFLKTQRNKSKEDVFAHTCPFLINGKCCVYNYRGIVCRTFGLMAIRKDSKPSIPFCANIGLNYSIVFDKKNKVISSKMLKESKIQTEPLVFNIDYAFLISDEYAKNFNLKFDEPKPLLERLN